MTAPSPTPSTLDAAVEAVAIVLAAASGHPWDRLEAKMGDLGADVYRRALRRVARNALTVAAPILAAADADLLAQAYAAGTAEGATAEREHIAASLRTSAALLRIAAKDCLDATLGGGSADYIATWDRERVRHLAAAQELETHADAIARAGTSEVDRG